MAEPSDRACEASSMEFLFIIEPTLLQNSFYLLKISDRLLA